MTKTIPRKVRANLRTGAVLPRTKDHRVLACPRGGAKHAPSKPFARKHGILAGIASAKWMTHTKYTKHTEIAQRPSNRFVSCGMLEFARAALCLRSLGWKYSEV